MQCTQSQQLSLDAIKAAMKDGHKYIYLDGAAGTGKTFLASHIAEGKIVAFIAPTGKAASVLRTRFGSDENAICFGTLHSATHKPIIDEALVAILTQQIAEAKDDDTIHALELQLAAVKRDVTWEQCEQLSWEPASKADVIILDEASMCVKRIGSHLMTLAGRSNVTIVAIGDFAQLPPVKDDPLINPQEWLYVPPLTEIVRQAADSPIIRLAHAIRTGAPRPLAPACGRVAHMQAGSIPGLIEAMRPEAPFWSGPNGQLLFWGNDNRKIFNRLWRGWGPPVVGEKMVVLKNRADIGVMNGEQFIIDEMKPTGDVVGRFTGDRLVTMRLHIEHQYTKDEALEVNTRLLPQPKKGDVSVAFAYAITAHKAQGSEWSRVIVWDDTEKMGYDAAKWLYTAVTRAKDQVILVK